MSFSRLVSQFVDRALSTWGVAPVWPGCHVEVYGDRDPAGDLLSGWPAAKSVIFPPPSVPEKNVAGILVFMRRVETPEYLLRLCSMADAVAVPSGLVGCRIPDGLDCWASEGISFFVKLQVFTPPAFSLDPNAASRQPHVGALLRKSLSGRLTLLAVQNLCVDMFNIVCPGILHRMEAQKCMKSQSVSPGASVASREPLTESLATKGKLKLLLIAPVSGDVSALSPPDFCDVFVFSGFPLTTRAANVKVISKSSELLSLRFGAVLFLHSSWQFTSSALEALCSSLLPSGGELYALGWNEQGGLSLDDGRLSAAFVSLLPGPQASRRGGAAPSRMSPGAGSWMEELKSQLAFSSASARIDVDIILRHDGAIFSGGIGASQSQSGAQDASLPPRISGDSVGPAELFGGGRRGAGRYLLRQKVSHPPGSHVFVASTVYPTLWSAAAQLSQGTLQRVKTALGEFRRIWEEHSSPLSYCRPASLSCFVVTSESNEALGIHLTRACEDVGFAPGELLLDSKLSTGSPASAVLSQQVIKTPVLLYEVELEDSEACVAALAQVHILFALDCTVSRAAGPEGQSILLRAYERVDLCPERPGSIVAYLQRETAAEAPARVSEAAQRTALSCSAESLCQTSVPAGKIADADGYVPISSNRQFYCMSKILFGTVTDPDGNARIKTPAVTDSSVHTELLPLYALTPSLPRELHLRGSKFIYYLACCVSPLGCPTRDLEYKLVNSAFDMAIAGASDAEIYRHMKSLSKRTDSSSFLNSRVSTRAEEIVAVLRATAVPEKRGETRRTIREPSPAVRRLLAGMQYDSMLDVGCADGRIAVQVAKKLGVPAGNACGIDVRATHNPELTFLRCNVERVALRDVVPPSSFSLCTCTMVLHHFRNWRDVLAQLYEALCPGGVLLIRESLPNHALIRYFLDIQHAMYAFIIQDEMPIDAFINGFSTNYFTEEELGAALRAPGFEILSWKYDNPADKFRKVWVIARKPPHGRVGRNSDLKPGKGPSKSPSKADNGRPGEGRAGVSIVFAGSKGSAARGQPRPQEKIHYSNAGVSISVPKPYKGQKRFSGEQTQQRSHGKSQKR